MLMCGSLNLSVVSGVVGAALRRPQLAASLSAYNEEQRRCGRRWIYLWGSMGVGLTPAPALLRDQAEGPGPQPNGTLGKKPLAASVNV